MLGRKTSGSVVCPSCGSLVGVNDERCYTCGRAKPGLFGFAPLLRQFGNDLGFVPLVIGVCSLLFLASGLLEMQSSGSLPLMGFRNSDIPRAFGASGALPVFGEGAWWTVLSATWLHGSLIHIFFNMMSLRNIGYDTVEILGPGRTVIVYVISGACGFLLTSLMGLALPLIVTLPLPIFILRLLVGATGITVGASASIFGLVGALVHYGRKSGSRHLHSQVLQWALIMFLYGFFIQGVDNWAHAGGFIGGYLTSAVMNPLQREKGDHLLVAILCLAASFAAVAYSLFTHLGSLAL